MPPRIAQPAAFVAGTLLLFASIAGYAARWTNQTNAFPSDLWQDAAHLAIGAYMVGMAMKGEGSSAAALWISACLCALFAGLALYQLGSSEVAMIFDNSLLVSKTSCWFHLALGGLQAGGAALNTSKRQLLYD